MLNTTSGRLAGEPLRPVRWARVDTFHTLRTMPGSDSDEDIDDGEFDNDGEEDIDQEIFEAIEAGAEDATDGDPVGSQPP